MTVRPRERATTTTGVVGGVGTMLGAGVFLGLAPAAGLAGRWMLVGLAVAALAAVCTACSFTDLARAYPGLGGGHRYARDLLGRWPGRMAGGVGLLGRIAGIAAIAGCFGAYATPRDPHLGALVVILLAVGAELAALRLSPLVSRVLVAVVVLALAVVVVACFAAAVPPQPNAPGLPGADDPAELLPAAGLLFVGFLGGDRGGSAGRSRPRVLVPLVILAALGTYLAVSTALLRELGPTRLALSSDPLRAALAAANASALDPILIAGVGAAAIGVLFALVGGTRQTTQAMADAGDLPTVFGTGGYGKTLAGTVTVGAAGTLAMALLTPVAAIQLAATCALFAAAFTNAAARLLERHERVWPARTACFGLGLCVLLVVEMPPVALTLAVLAMAVGAALGPLATLTRRKPVLDGPRHARRALKI